MNTPNTPNSRTNTEHSFELYTFFQKTPNLTLSAVVATAARLENNIHPRGVSTMLKVLSGEGLSEDLTIGGGGEGLDYLTSDGYMVTGGRGHMIAIHLLTNKAFMVEFIKDSP